jgi:hypothetical protein
MSFRFPATDYAAAFRKLVENQLVNRLGPDKPHSELLSTLKQLNLQSFEQPVVDEQMAQCCISAVWLLHNFLDESHTISQEIETSEGSYLHGIMHRREPDYSNAKYWFRRVGKHPIFAQLSKALSESQQGEVAGVSLLADGHWQSDRFVDACQLVARSKNASEIEQLEQIAQLEWQLLFDYCYRHSVADLPARTASK